MSNSAEFRRCSPTQKPPQQKACSVKCKWRQNAHRHDHQHTSDSQKQAVLRAILGAPPITPSLRSPIALPKRHLHPKPANDPAPQHTTHLHRVIGSPAAVATQKSADEPGEMTMHDDAARQVTRKGRSEAAQPQGLTGAVQWQCRRRARIFPAWSWWREHGAGSPQA